MAYKMGNLDRANRMYQAALRFDSTNIQALRNLGMLANQEGDQDRARQYFETAYQYDSTDAEVCNNLGAMHDQGGDLLKALAFYRKAVALDSTKVLFLVNIGNAYARNNQAATALPYLKRAAHLRPRDKMIPYHLANCFAEMNMFDSSEHYYSRSVQQGGNNAILYYRLGLSRQNQGKIEQAIGDFKQALSLRPRYPECQLSLANLYALLTRYDEAIKLLDEVLEAAPDLHVARISLGAAHALSGHQIQADSILQQLYQVDSTLGQQMEQLISAEVARLRSLMER
ncbi:MAG: tetratricopeptide repeat protein [Candidatus Zixiibacteriota bacterium]|nr:MAG: tetratricopeptide repeat protein [candidate division Zixibacteria bacterium]